MFQVAYADRIVPGVHVLGIDLGGQSIPGARALLDAAAEDLSHQPVTLRANGLEWQVAAQETGMRVDADAMADQAYAIGRAGGPVQRTFTELKSVFFGFSLSSPLLRFDLDRELAVLSSVADQVNRPPMDAQLNVQPRTDGGYGLAITPEVPGTRLVLDDSAERIRVAISRGLPTTVDLAVEVEQPRITQAKLEAARTLGQPLLASPATVTHRGSQWTLTITQIAAALTFSGGPDAQIQPHIDPSALEPALGPIRTAVDLPAQDARFSWDGKSVQPIREGKEGLGVDAVALARQLEQGLATGVRTFDLPIGAIAPTISSQDGSKLAIKELIQEGRTGFAGAVPAKRHNIELAASRLNGTVVEPGAIFSFNKEVGPTTLAAGFQTGWGITLSNDGAQTVPSVAGGICQVATTLFHPVFHSGYAIEERHPHLYWIQSYGQPPLGMKGLDTTVDEEFGLDFQFINNTPNPLLIQSRVDGSTLLFDLYGTKPDWNVKIDGPSIANVVPTEREIVRQNDPTMPAGNQLQVESAQDGFDVSILRTVTSSEGDRRLDLRSHYITSRNVILYGGPVETDQPADGASTDGGPTGAPNSAVAPGPPAASPPAASQGASQPVAVPTTTASSSTAQPTAVQPVASLVVQATAAAPATTSGMATGAAQATPRVPTPQPTTIGGRP
jgi:vancomycin resistance protein YoaR